MADLSVRHLTQVCRDFGIRTVFRSRPTLWDILTKVKDPLPTGKQSTVVYEVLCTCGKVYIGETKRRLETRLKEHTDAFLILSLMPATYGRKAVRGFSILLLLSSLRFLGVRGADADRMKD